MTSETDILSSIHKALIGFDKRAERTSDEILEATFVDSAPLFDLLSSKNNQVIYGRRGTGKTHALKYLARYVEKTNERPIYIDLRSVGSNGSIYSDGSRPLAERASTLILDVLNAVHGELYVLAVQALDKALDAYQDGSKNLAKFEHF
jgi:Cdc6-like AAA superfamily ATPase